MTAGLITFYFFSIDFSEAHRQSFDYSTVSLLIK